MILSEVETEDPFEDGLYDVESDNNTEHHLAYTADIHHTSAQQESPLAHFATMGHHSHHHDDDSYQQSCDTEDDNTSIISQCHSAGHVIKNDSYK